MNSHVIVLPKIQFEVSNIANFLVFEQILYDTAALQQYLH